MHLVGVSEGVGARLRIGLSIFTNGTSDRLAETGAQAFNPIMTRITVARQIDRIGSVVLGGEQLTGHKTARCACDLEHVDLRALMILNEFAA